MHSTVIEEYWHHSKGFFLSSMAIWVVEFSNGGYKIRKNLPKNQHTQRKLLNVENWISREASKSAKSPNLLTFKVNFLVKNYPNHSQFFCIEEYQFRRTFFVIDIF